MKNKIIAIAVFSTAAAAGSLSAQQMVAGWDFSQFAFDGFSSVDGSTLTGDVDANYTGTSADFAGGAAVGSFHYDGAFGSTALSLNPADVEPQGVGNLTVADRGFLGTTGSLLALGSQGQANTTGRGLGFNTGAEGDAFVIAIDLGSDLGSAWSFTFGAVTLSDDASSIDWEWSVDGTGYNDASVTSSITDTAGVQTVDLSGIAGLDGQSEVFFRGTFSGIDAGLTVIDNIGVDATVVPEPSAYAALFGAVALAFAAVRRRK